MAEAHTTATDNTATDNTIVYEPSRDPELARWIRSDGVLEHTSRMLDLTEHPPVRLTAQDCGTANAYYRPANREIRLCYELVDAVAQQFGRTDRALRVIAFVLQHEVGHAYIDLLDLPMLGREEDAADQLAALWHLVTKDRGLAETVLAAAQFFRISERDAPLWGEHALGDVRYFNLLCLIYASIPELRDTIAHELPAARAERCADELDRTRRGWDRLLAPHARR